MKILFKHLPLVLLLFVLPATARLGTPRRVLQVSPDERYIVRCGPRASKGACHGLATAFAADNDGEVLHTYENVFNGFALGSINENALEALINNGLIETVNPDVEAEAVATQTLSTSPNQWGLDRIDQRDFDRNNPPKTYHYNNDGAGVTVYVLDTGVKIDHAEFDGRASKGYNAVAGESHDVVGSHGTHCAGTVAGENFGVAKNSLIVDVKVLQGSGSGWTSDVVEGLDWVLANAVSGSSLVSMSINSNGVSSDFEAAIHAVYLAGIPVIGAAGNDSGDACGYTPPSSPYAFAVGATDNADKKAGFSNYGPCVDIFAPGVSIVSAGVSSINSYSYMSGTSMATPHVAGAAALILHEHSGWSARQVYSKLSGDATGGKIPLKGSPTLKSSPNLILYTLDIGETTADPPPPPPETDPPETDPPETDPPRTKKPKPCNNPNRCP